MESGSELINQPTEVKSEETVLKSRFNERSGQRVVEYLTGLKMDDPELINRLEEDQKIIRAKYGLPDRKYIFSNPSDYENFLRKLIADNEIELKSTRDCGNFFEKYPDALGIASDDGRSIAADINKNSIEEYYESLFNLEHETIHALQTKFYPNMKIEHQEYEAHLAGWDMDQLKNNSLILDSAFNYYLMGSINGWYEDKNEDKKEKIKPEWNSPEWFLKNVDHISDEKIKEYKERKEKERVQMYGDAKKESLDNVRV